MRGRSQQTNLFRLVRPVLCAGESSSDSIRRLKRGLFFIHWTTAIELGVLPTPYVKRGFKFPLLTPNA